MIKPLLLALALSATGAHAMVIGGKIVDQTGTGEFEILDPTTGFTVGSDNFDSCNLFAFDEDQNIVLSEPIRVDIGPNSGMIAQGTEVASHYVFFDSVNGTHFGYVDFDAPILGVAAFQDTMGATDFLANTDVFYIGEELRGLENGDRAWIDPDNPDRLWVSWAGSSPGDYIRVFTARSVGAAMM
ncbi:hypothetical protein SAMN05444287_1951 [Octadecabacter temperatus]|jgi:hypothetical protein|uniref:Uncharacterized protein n=1 Tax=Octadecabacter temperatus TaxID=1458307 RepID=A0A0K0Y7I5_9RHOB|nr:hypothetical protein [Octadecabacter temperatus]AKS46827.1 hypothetical protein OSB_22910 [Octadecabacter temperatus]SIO22022.1 hypothetical protein SAMN05444287_1951 [Octadecabacter temperatus]